MITSYFIALKFKYNTKARLKQNGPDLKTRMVNLIKRSLTFWTATRTYSSVENTFFNFVNNRAASWNL